MDTEVKKGELCPFCGRADKLRRSVIDKDWVCYNCGKAFDTPGRPGKKDKGQAQVTESQPHIVNKEEEIETDTDAKKGDLCPFCGSADKLHKSVIDKDWICYNCGQSFDTLGQPGSKGRGQSQIAEPQPPVVGGKGEIDDVDQKTETPSESVPIIAKDHRRQALNHKLKDEWDYAIGEYTKAIELDDNWVLAHYERGELFKRLGKKTDAIADFEKVISLSHDRETLKPANRHIEELKK